MKSSSLIKGNRQEDQEQKIHPDELQYRNRKRFGDRWEWF